MTKEYDFQKAKKIIKDNEKTLLEACLGIQEDWFWTAETVWEDGEFIKNLDEIKHIGGIPGSVWATPVIRLEHKSGKDEVFECFTGESSGFNTMGSMMISGPLSSAAQENMPNAKEYNKNS